MRTRIGGTTSRALAVVVIAAAAAGGALARSASPTPVQQALAKTTRAGSFQYRLSLLLTSTGVGGGKQYTITGSGASDFRHHKGTMTLDVGSFVSALGIKIGTRPLPSKLTLLTLNKVVYVHLPQLSAQYPGKQWLKIDPKTLPKSQTGGADIGGLVSALSPQQALTLLGGATSVRLVGHEKVSGVVMTRYKAVIDATKLAGSVPPAQRAGVRQALRQLGLSKVGMDVWIDGAGYIRLIVTDAVKLATTSTSGSGTASTTRLKLGMGFGAYGATVTVTAPPASSTVDLGSMLQQASG